MEADRTEVAGMIKIFFERHDNLWNLAWSSFQQCSGLREMNLLMTQICIVGIHRIPCFHHLRF